MINKHPLRLVLGILVTLLVSCGNPGEETITTEGTTTPSQPTLVAVKMVDCEAYRELMNKEIAKSLLFGGDISKVYHALNQKFTTEGMVEISQLEWQQIEESRERYGLQKGHYMANQSSYTWTDSKGESHESWNICFTFDADGANTIKNYLDSAK